MSDVHAIYAQLSSTLVGHGEIVLYSVGNTIHIQIQTVKAERKTRVQRIPLHCVYTLLHAKLYFHSKCHCEIREYIDVRTVQLMCK